MPKRKPEPIDIRVGENIRSLRLAKGLSQASISHVLGVSFQQIQKYERGTNRVDPVKLGKLARALGVPVERFFEEPGSTSLATPSEGHAIRMLRALALISDNGTRLSLVQLVETVAEAKAKT
jgi:transcriptional regulator with XRE-family HTH domain